MNDREALGAGRLRILRHLLAESLLLASLGGALGLALAMGGVRLLLRIAPADLPRLDVVPIDRTVLVFALVVTALTGVVMGLVPAWRLASSELRSLMNEGCRGAQGSRRRNRVFGALVVAEMALAVLLVIGAGLLVRTYSNLTAADPGFNPDRVLTFFMNVPGRTDISFEGMGDDDRPRFSGSHYQPLADFFRELKERIRGLPGVESVATANRVPLAPAQYDNPAVFTLPDQPGGNDPESGSVARSRCAGAEFFSTMEMGLLRGRGFQPTDRQGSPGVAIISESFGRRYFSGLDPLGQRIHYPENRFVPGDIGFQNGLATIRWTTYRSSASSRTSSTSPLQSQPSRRSMCLQSSGSTDDELSSCAHR